MHKTAPVGAVVSVCHPARGPQHTSARFLTALQLLPLLQLLQHATDASSAAAASASLPQPFSSPRRGASAAAASARYRCYSCYRTLQHTTAATARGSSRSRGSTASLPKGGAKRAAEASLSLKDSQHHLCCFSHRVSARLRFLSALSREGKHITLKPSSSRHSLTMCSSSMVHAGAV